MDGIELRPLSPSPSTSPLIDLGSVELTAAYTALSVVDKETEAMHRRLMEADGRAASTVHLLRKSPFFSRFLKFAL